MVSELRDFHLQQATLCGLSEAGEGGPPPPLPVLERWYLRLLSRERCFLREMISLV